MSTWIGTGSGLAAKAQHRAHVDRLSTKLFGNPHSINPTSNVATKAVEDARRRVLAHFNASPDEYVAIFTSNATGAARLAGEAYPFRRGTRLVLTGDNHNSINGLREFARRRHARTVYIPTCEKDLRVREGDVEKALAGGSSLSCLSLPHRLFSRIKTGDDLHGRKGLFAYPAQSNFSGVRHPLEWVNLAQENGYRVLLDAAAYLPTATLDLSGPVKPDFIIASWYKLFGYPTGLGCLIARRDALACLRRPWFSGGTIQAVTVNLPKWHIMAANEAGFEDGTVNFLGIPDIAVGLDWLQSVGMPVIQTRVRCLTGWFIHRLGHLRHSNGLPMIRIYGPSPPGCGAETSPSTSSTRRASWSTSAWWPSSPQGGGHLLAHGCFCNPGCGETAFGLRLEKMLLLLWTPAKTIDDYVRVIGLPSAVGHPRLLRGGLERPGRGPLLRLAPRT